MALVSVASFKSVALSTSDLRLFEGVLLQGYTTHTNLDMVKSTDGSLFVLVGGLQSELEPTRTLRVYKLTYNNGVYSAAWGIAIVGTTTSQYVFGEGLAVSPTNGNVYVAGTTGSASKRSSVLFTISSDGLLTKSDCFEFAYGRSVVCDGAGAVYFVSQGDMTSPYQYVKCIQVRKLVNGVSVWTKALAGTGQNPDKARIRYLNNHLYLVGRAVGSSSTGGLVEIFDTNGTSVHHCVVSSLATGTSGGLSDIVAPDLSTYYAIGPIQLMVFENALRDNLTLTSGPTCAVRASATDWFAAGGSQIWKMTGKTRVAVYELQSTLGHQITAFGIEVDGSSLIVLGAVGGSVFIARLDMSSTKPSIPAGSGHVTLEVLPYTALTGSKQSYGDAKYSFVNSVMYTGSASWSSYTCSGNAYNTAPYTPAIPSITNNWWNWTGVA